MAARLTNTQKQKIIADYMDLGNYSAVSKIHGVSAATVRNVVLKQADIAEIREPKNARNTAGILSHMEQETDIVCQILSKGLAVLNDEAKLREATPAQLITAISTLIDKWTAISSGPADTVREDGLSQSLKKLGEELNNDDQ